jgi:3-(3-hydroxy-phenyl)propionate hydroxylase
LFQYKTYPFKKPTELGGEENKIYDVVVVGAGPVGLTMALSLAKQGIKVVLLDDSNQVSVGSRAICFSKRTLEIFDKLGVAQPMSEKGIQWNVGKIFFQDKEIDRFDLSPEKISKYPAFINLQQYYVEQYLIDAVSKEKNADIRWLNKVVNVQQLSNDLKPSESLVQVEVETPEGNYFLKTKYVVACDGCRSSIRNLLKLELEGERFEERFLIADFIMKADFPSERWFWFDPPFAKGQSILLHKQPDNLWRLDFKLGKHADNSIASDHDFIREKIKCVVGDRPFEIDWTSVYSFSSKMLKKFVHGNIIFAGDSAHVVSPFGARGANSGIEDADNLSWKLVSILKGKNSGQLLNTYNDERTEAAGQNIVCTTHSTLFIAPPTLTATKYRNEILEKAAADIAFKKQINCGRLSIPNIYGKYPDSEQGNWLGEDVMPGSCIKDCYIKNREAYLVEKLSYQFTVMILEGTFTNDACNLLKEHDIAVLAINPENNLSLITTYDLTPGSAYLLTPDQYILGRWKKCTAENAIALKKTYLSGQVYKQNILQKTGQELLDEQVAGEIVRLTD